MNTLISQPDILAVIATIKSINDPSLQGHVIPVIHWQALYMFGIKWHLYYCETFLVFITIFLHENIPFWPCGDLWMWLMCIFLPHSCLQLYILPGIWMSRSKSGWARVIQHLPALLSSDLKTSQCIHVWARCRFPGRRRELFTHNHLLYCIEFRYTTFLQC